jgi:hypothetical protein
MYWLEWPSKVGIDEHLFKHDFRLEQRRFVTIVVDHKNKRLMELVEGKSSAELTVALQHIPGFFPNAQLVADKPSSGSSRMIQPPGPFFPRPKGP